MRRVAFVPLLALAFAACQDATQPSMRHAPMLASTASGNPFIGTWEGTDTEDDSDLKITIGGGSAMHVWLRDAGGSNCVRAGLGFVPLSIEGFGSITADEPPTLELIGDMYCYPRSQAGRQLIAEDAGPFPFVYRPESDTLDLLGICLYRPGNSQSCAV